MSLAMFLKLFKHVSTSGTLCWPGTVVAGFQILPVVVPACNISFGGLRVRFLVPAHKICLCLVVIFYLGACAGYKDIGYRV